MEQIELHLECRYLNDIFLPNGSRERISEAN